MGVGAPLPSWSWLWVQFRVWHSSHDTSPVRIARPSTDTILSIPGFRATGRVVGGRRTLCCLMVNFD